MNSFELMNDGWTNKAHLKSLLMVARDSRVAMWLSVVAVGGCAAPVEELSREKVFNGVNAEPGEFPFAAYITDNGRFVCSAVLAVDNRTLLTAAHCLTGGRDLSRLAAVIGTTERGVASNAASNEQVAIEQVAIAPGYAEVAKGGCGIDHQFADDLAVLRLAEEVPGHVEIALASVPAPEDATLRALGWGAYDNSLVPSSTLQHTEQTPANDSGEPTHVLRFQNPTSATCTGDSGGPVVHFEQGSWTLVGITAYGIGLGCVAGRVAGVVDVSRHHQWIIDTAALLANDPQVGWRGQPACFDRTRRPERLAVAMGLPVLEAVRGRQTSRGATAYTRVTTTNMGYWYATAGDTPVRGQLLFRNPDERPLNELTITLTHGSTHGYASASLEIIDVVHSHTFSRVQFREPVTSGTSVFAGLPLSSSWQSSITDPQGHGLEMIFGEVQVSLRGE